MQINKINATAVSTAKTSPAFQAKEVEEKAPAVKPAADNFKKEYKEKTEAEKEEIIYKARTNASGWSVFAPAISSLYFYLRKDSTIADKYGLDKKEDKKFIEEVRTKQAIATLPGVFGFGLFGWLGFKFFAKPEKA